MSALPPKADIGRRQLDIRFVPKADIAPQKKHHRREWDSGSEISQNSIAADLTLSEKRLCRQSREMWRFDSSTT
jgi:hypothetical protein